MNKNMDEKTQQLIELLEQRNESFNDFMEQTMEAVNNIGGAGKFTINKLDALFNILIEKGIIEAGDLRTELDKLSEHKMK